jgi:hypothetical protein
MAEKDSKKKKGKKKKGKKKSKKKLQEEEDDAPVLEKGPDEPAPSKKDKKRDLGVTPEMLAGKKKKKEEDKAPPLLCPDCGAELEEGMKKCPDCGTALAEGEEIVCAVCGAVVDSKLGVCLLCGTKFISKEKAEGTDEFPIEDFAHKTRKRHKPTVKIGEDEEEPEKKPKRPKKKVEEPVKPVKKRPKKRPKVKRPPPKRSFLQSPAMFPAVICLLLVIAALSVHFTTTTRAMAIDGEFKDWEDIVAHKDDADPLVQESIDIVQYKVKTEDGKIFLYMKTEGKMFPGGMDQASFVNIFIDVDGDPTTGYLVNSVGSEYRIEIKGWDGEAQSAKYYTFRQSGDPVDWQDFTETGNVEAASSGSELEVGKTLSTFNLDKESTPSIMFSVRSHDGYVDMSSSPVGLMPGGIAVTQYLKMPTAPVAQGTTDLEFLTIKLEAKGKDDKITMMTLTRLGEGTVGDVSNIALYSSDTKVDDGKFIEVGDHQQLTLEPYLLVKVGKPVILTLKMDIWEKAPGKTLGAQVLTAKDIHFEESPVALYTVQDGAKLSYLNSTPANPRVDGAFGDWTESNSDKVTLPSGIPYKSIDVTTMWSKVIKDGHLKVQVEVSGEIMSGHPVPEYPTYNASPTFPKTGEDTFIIYIDTDSDPSTGLAYGGLGVEYAVFIHGKYGDINQGTIGFYDFDAGKSIWEKLSGDGVDAYTDLHRIEVELDLSKSGLQTTGDDYSYLVMMRNHDIASIQVGIIEG